MPPLPPPQPTPPPGVAPPAGAAPPAAVAPPPIGSPSDPEAGPGLGAPVVVPPGVVSPGVVPPDARKRALGGAFVRGMVWSTLALVVSKFSSLLATLALAWPFGAEEYWAFAAAKSASMVGDFLTDGGMRRVVITRGNEYARIARTAFRVSLGFNLLGCLLMFGTASLFVSRFDVAAQVYITGVALVLATFGSIQRLKLASDLRFARSAFVYTISALLRNVLTVVFAFAGLGPLAFALPVLFVAAWEALYARRHVGPLPHGPGTEPTPSLARELIGQGKWVIFATVGSALVARGDYLVSTSYFGPDAIRDAAGQIVGASPAGLYFWAFQLTLALFSPLTLGLATVIQPVMAQIGGDGPRRASAFSRMVRVAVFLAVPASLASVGVAPLIIHPIRHGYWDPAIVAVQLLAASECVRQLHPMSTATLEAAGRWRTAALVVLIDGALTLLAAAIGCLVGGTLFGLALAVAVGRTLTALAQAAYTYRQTGGSARALLRQVLASLTIGGLVALGLGTLTSALTSDASTHRWLLALAGALAVPAYFALARLLTPATFREASDLLMSRIRSRRL